MNGRPGPWRALKAMVGFGILCQGEWTSLEGFNQGCKWLQLAFGVSTAVTRADGGLGCGWSSGIERN